MSVICQNIVLVSECEGDEKKRSANLEKLFWTINDDKDGEMHLLNVKLLEIFFWDSSNWALKHSGPCIQFSNYNDNDVSCK